MEALFLGGTLERVRTVANGMGAGLGLDWCEDFHDRLYALLRDRAELMPGVESLLDRLDAEGIVYAVGHYFFAHLDGQLEKGLAVVFYGNIQPVAL